MEKDIIADLPGVVKSFLERYIKDNSLESAKIIARPAVSKGNNFMGIVDRVTVTAVQNGEETEINFIMKVPVSDEALHNVFSLHLFFKREIYVYKHIVKLYEDIQRNVPDAEKFKFPNCYFTNSTKSEECILLKDLVKEDFKVHDRLKRVDFEHASLAMEAVGKMHAISFYVQENMKEKFARYKQDLDDVVVNTFALANTDNANSPLGFRLEEMLNVLDCEEHKDKLKIFGSNFVEHMTAPSLPDSYSVISHGDCWTGNMLFKYVNDEPVEVRLVDYQWTRFTPPILDLAYFICCCTDGAFRKLHFDDILEVYYNALSKHLSHFSMKASDVYPRRVFYEQLKRYFSFGIAAAVMNLSNATRDEADAHNISEVIEEFMNEGDKEKHCNSELFKLRANDLVRDSINYGYM